MHPARRKASFRVCIEDQPFITWGHSQDIRTARHVEGQTSGDDNLIRCICIAKFGRGMRRSNHSLFEPADRIRNDAIRSPRQGEAPRSADHRRHNDDGHPWTFPRHQRRSCAALAEAADRLDVGRLCDFPRC